jgi:hypothetical protein
MMPNSMRRSPVSGAQLVAVLAAILFATVVLPPAAAWILNRTRIAQTRERVRAATGHLRASRDDMAGLMRGAGIVCGPGRLPVREPAAFRARAGISLASHRAWLRGARMAPELFGSGMPTDAWGRCFLVNADALSSPDPVWLLSAGPNGVIDTPPNALALGGDDIGDRLR